VLDGRIDKGMPNSGGVKNGQRHVEGPVCVPERALGRSNRDWQSEGARIERARVRPDRRRCGVALDCRPAFGPKHRLRRPRTCLRVCADPNNMPLSNSKR